MLDILMFATEPFGTWGPGTTGEPSINSWEYWQKGSRSEVFRNLMLAAVAVVALLFGIWRSITAYLQTRASQRQADAANEQAVAANEQARIAQQGHVTERFSRAVEQLGSENLPVRIGGIYALWRLITDSPEDAVRVMDVLCAFVRNPPHEPTCAAEPAAEYPGEAIAGPQLRPDVQAVLDLLGDAEAAYRRFVPADYRLNLRGAKLRVAVLDGKNLRDTDLVRADLAWALLVGANLTRANLTSADLTRASLREADLDLARLAFADISGADFNDAKNIPDLKSAVADFDNPPRGLPVDVIWSHRN